MPRGVKGTSTYNTQLEKIDQRIERYTRLLEDLNQQREDLLEKKRAIEMKDLYNYMSDVGLTAIEVLEKIKP